MLQIRNNLKMNSAGKKSENQLLPVQQANVGIGPLDRLSV